MKNKKNNKIAFTGGGTGGHIYPGLAVADELKILSKTQDIEIIWIASSSGMDKKIVESATDSFGNKLVNKFYGVPSGKLRRYFSFKNVLDLFKIFAGFVSSFFILLKNRPAVLFSKGGFVSVPPCLSAKILGIPVFTHECDFTPGLATKINSRFAKKILLSYKETVDYFGGSQKLKTVVTGNPVRPVFYSASKKKGKEFLSIKKSKPILLVMGGSLGARQINDIVKENIEWLCSNFIVVHQTGEKNIDQSNVSIPEKIKENYKCYPFIYSQMPDVIAAADIVLSRSGANSLWECSVLGKPMLLIPLSGSGTRGDQEDNAEYFAKAGAALVLKGNNLKSEVFQKSVLRLYEQRELFSKSCKKIASGTRPSEKIAKILYTEIVGDD